MSVVSECRMCGACCIAPSICSFIPGMSGGKPANERCVNLTNDNRCSIYGSPERPAFCIGYKASHFCGSNVEEAMQNLRELEEQTRPDLG